MGKKVAKLALVLAAIIFMASAGFAQTTTTTNCTATSTSGSSTNVDCTSTSNTPPSAADNAAAIEQSRKTGEAMGHAAAAPLVVLGQALARKRAIRQQEKSDLTAVVFCRQNPSGSWTFPGKAPMPCGTLDKNVVAYCTVNSKTALCKDVAKLGPAPGPAQAAAAASATGVLPEVQPQPQHADDLERLNAIYCKMHTEDEIKMTSESTQAACRAIQAKSATSPAAQPYPQPQPQQAPVTTQPVQSVVVPQSQPQTQPQTVEVTTTPEVSVAEAARRNKAAKEAQKAKEAEKAKENPNQ